jgi:dTMP kinase
LQQLYHITAGNFKPDLTLILDIDVEKGMRRSFAKAKSMAVKELRFESRELEFHNNLRRGFLEIAQNNAERCVVLNADKSIDELHYDIVEVINKKLRL